MADIKISQLGSAITVDDSDIVPVVSGGNTLKATAAQLKEHAIGNTSISGIGDGSVTGAISALNSDKQPKTLATSITVDGTPQTTVEGALGAINTDLGSTKQALTTTNNVLGAKNLLQNTATSQVINGLAFTVNSNGTITVNGTSSGWVSYTVYSGTFAKGTYILSDGGMSVLGAERLEITNSAGTEIIASNAAGANVEFTLNNDTEIICRIACGTGKTISNKTFYPMVRPVGTDGTYVPYAMTNRELTLAKTMQISGTLEASTGDYIIANALPYGGFIPLAGYYLTSGGQYRPLTIGYSGRGLIILGATSDMASRPYIVMGYNSNY